mmetsp:Transcript_94278/g.163039  ORF Transcript_94278/g.163039 Transcript_94278/m.163039 type:complete len:249 (-) Transcript_94278:1128-1874(-)
MALQMLAGPATDRIVNHRKCQSILQRESGGHGTNVVVQTRRFESERVSAETVRPALHEVVDPQAPTVRHHDMVAVQISTGVVKAKLLEAGPVPQQADGGVGARGPEGGRALFQHPQVREHGAVMTQFVVLLWHVRLLRDGDVAAPVLVLQLQVEKDVPSADSVGRHRKLPNPNGKPGRLHQTHDLRHRQPEGDIRRQRPFPNDLLHRQELSHVAQRRDGLGPQGQGTRRDPQASVPGRGRLFNLHLRH